MSWFKPPLPVNLWYLHRAAVWRCDALTSVCVCLLKQFLVCSLCLCCRPIRRIPRATAASQDLRFCCRNSWRGNRCRKRWQSSYEKGICGVICFHTSVLGLPWKPSIKQTISPIFFIWCSFMYIIVAQYRKHTWKLSELHKSCVVIRLCTSLLG